MKGKVCLVTGATSGIGEASAFGLARLGAHLVLAGRSEGKCKTTASRISSETGNRSIEYLVADLSVLAGIRKLASDFLARLDRLHVLVNNAGGFYNRRQETADGLELSFVLNHISYFLLTGLLLDTLKASAPARIINVTSGIHLRERRMPFEDLQTTKGYKGFKAYGRSKLANVLFTYELARRLEGSGVTVNAVNPGLTATNLGMQDGGMMAAMKRMVDRIGGKSPQESAETIVYQASSPEVEGITGKYFEKMKPVRSSKASYDREAAARLWEISEKMTGLVKE